MSCYNPTTYTLHSLSCLDGFKMYRENGDLIIEADNVKFNCSCLSMEEAILEAFIFIKSRTEARFLVKNAKIVL